MSGGCCPVEHSGPIPVCPATGSRTKPVGRRTLEALLKPEAKAALTPQPYYFCDSAGCNVVYVSARGDHLVTKDELTVRVGVKEREDPAPLCYCFGYDRKTIQDEVRATGTTDIPKTIAARVKAGECRCEVTNPSGDCCLGSIYRAVQAAQGRKTGLSTAASPAPGRPGGLLGIGGLLVAVLASFCCVGPVVLGALGLGAVAIGAGLDKFRPLLMVVTAGLLAGAFYFVYRKREVACEDGSCRTESSGRATKIGLWIVTGLAVAAFAFPYLRGASSGGTSVLEPGTQRVALAVSGMTCSGCAFNVGTALNKVPGVKGARVNFEGKTAEVVVEQGKVGVEELVGAVKKIGYDAQVIR